jgi:hypothetical protein
MAAPDEQGAWVAPALWALILGAVVVLASFAAFTSAVRWVGVAIGGALIAYFVSGYVAAARRGEVPSDWHDDTGGPAPPAGPFTT